MLALIALNVALAAEGPGSPACDAAIDNARTGKPVESATLRTLDSGCLRLVKHAVYARYGMKMRDDDLRQYFSTQSWYTPSPSYNDGLLQPADHANLQRMQEAEYDALVADAVTRGALWDLGPGCPAPATGPFTAVCLDGSRGQFQLVSATPAAGGVRYYNYDVATVNGPPSADPYAQGCVVVPGHLGVRNASVKADPTFQKTLSGLCVALQAEVGQTPGSKVESCTALAGDLDGDGVPEGIVTAKISNTQFYEDTRVYRSVGGQPSQVAAVCTYAP